MLRRLANDRRWRIREAVAMALQRIGEDDALELERILSAWLEHATFLEKRAAVAALAHPPLLGNTDFIRKCLEISNQLLADLAGAKAQDRKGEDFEVLKKGLGYARQDRDISWVIKENLKKSRSKKFAERVERVSRGLA